MIVFCNTLTISQAKQLSRDQLISWLEWNDSNGNYSDEDSEMMDLEPLTQSEALNYVLNQIDA